MERIVDLLVRCYEYDVSVFSQPWIYWTVIPALAYLVFFLVKWAVLTAPAWLPVWIVVSEVRSH